MLLLVCSGESATTKQQEHPGDLDEINQPQISSDAYVTFVANDGYLHAARALGESLRATSTFPQTTVKCEVGGDQIKC